MKVFLLFLSIRTYPGRLMNNKHSYKTHIFAFIINKPLSFSITRFCVGQEAGKVKNLNKILSVYIGVIWKIKWKQKRGIK